MTIDNFEKLGTVLEALKVESFPKDTKHLIHDILKLQNVDLVVDKEMFKGGDIALKGGDLTSIAIQMVVVNFKTTSNVWDLNPIRNFCIMVGADALPIVRMNIQDMSDYLESKVDGSNFGAGHNNLVHLVESINDQGILIVYPRTPSGGEELIKECSVTQEGIKVWLQHVAQTAN